MSKSILEVYGLPKEPIYEMTIRYTVENPGIQEIDEALRKLDFEDEEQLVYRGEAFHLTCHMSDWFR